MPTPCRVILLVLFNPSYTLAILSLIRFTVTVTAPGPTLLPQPPTAPPTIPASYASDSVFQHTVLTVTNRYRHEHNATALTWNPTLEASSRHWARQCHWAHSTSGENLAMGYTNVTAAVQAWGDERTLFDFSKPRFTHETGHFSQLVWKGTRTVGCARFHCGDYAGREDDGDDVDAYGWYVVCQYYPVGNIIGREFFKDNVQARITGGAVRVSLETYKGWAVVVILSAMLVGVCGVG
ncbi:hypothetical protein AJ78_03288 [Emergomyces pasteurianus Ep9510]|uniref:SCP domain-containing protein n=1 Tax=Emergomyces pasteurianus Ep9510 TaxID=1447872 RepID=A0A1J9QK49_9EURO|nr:hypothetical protein AJ78_03288 [Emergomyces pasteurianus Ep9510]